METMEDAILVHSPEYANWVFDASHPTQGRRFLHARNRLLLTAQSRKLNIDEIEPKILVNAEFILVHDQDYVFDVMMGKSNEWAGENRKLGDLARLMAGGTVQALDELLDKRTLTAVNFAGAKHHAQRDYSSGFCVFADFAIAAEIATTLGKKVAIFDFDAHHGDGTENLLKDNPDVMTFSVHQFGIFPGTGLITDWAKDAINYPLAADSGDKELFDAVASFNDAATMFKPDLIFIAAGADGLKNDPLAQLNYSLEGMHKAMQMIRLGFMTTPILLGGAGGYQPDTETPDAWVQSVLGLIDPFSPYKAI